MVLSVMELTESSDLTEPLSLFEQQPTNQSLVWQANPLSIARYQLGETEQKLLLYAISMIDGSVFARYRIHVAIYAEACGIGTNALYAQLRAAAESIATKPLVLTGHKAEDGKTVDLLTHWFSEVEFGSGYIDVLFPRALKSYLLGVKREFYKFPVQIPLHLSREYSIRLYQFCKRWEFGHSKLVTLGELRSQLGTIDLDQKGKPIRERFPKYGDLKKWVLQPAIDDINRVSDVLVRMEEKKREGTKSVEAIKFRFLKNPNYRPLPGMLHLKDANPAVDLKIREWLDTLQEEFGLSSEQARMAVGKYGIDKVESKAEIVRSKPRENAAASLLTALEKDWQPTKQIGKKPVAKQTPAPTAPVQTSLPLVETEEDLERSRENLRQHIAAFKEQRKGVEPQSAPIPAKEEGPKYPRPTKKQIAARERTKAKLLKQCEQILAEENT